MTTTLRVEQESDACGTAGSASRSCCWLTSYHSHPTHHIRTHGYLRAGNYLLLITMTIAASAVPRSGVVWFICLFQTEQCSLDLHFTKTAQFSISGKGSGPVFVSGTALTPVGGIDVDSDEEEAEEAEGGGGNGRWGNG